MAVLNATNPPKLPFGKPVKLGTITTNTDQFQFTFSEPSYLHSGSLIFQIVPAAPGATITTLTVNVVFSLDGGVTFDPQTGNVGAATVASTTSALAFATNHLQSLAIPALGGQISARFNVTALTFGTATSADVWALVA